MNRRLYNRMIALLLTLLFCVSLAPRASAVTERIGDYRDLNPNAWYAKGVRYCVAKNIMSGFGKVNHLFEPDRTMNRAELATIVWRMDGSPVTGLSLRFDDVKEGIWYEEAVRWVLLNGIMDAETPSVFGAEQPIIREQLARALWRYAEYRNGFVPEINDPEFETYRDHDKVSPGAVDALRWANALGIMTGTKDIDGQYVLTPWAQVSRASAATILMRFSLDMGIYD